MTEPSPLATAGGWARYGVGEPDEDGLYPDYRVPPGARPPTPAPAPPQGAPVWWWSTIAARWDLVIRDLSALHGIDLHDSRTLDSPWPGVRTLILGLVSEPGSRLRQALVEEVSARGPDRR
ncbi:MAG: hypothetical protein ACFCVG_03165 [Kineosporiaceae bacterium]